MDRRGHASDAEEQSAMLQRAIRKPKPRADRADARTRGVTDHFAQPIAPNDFKIVV